MVLYKTDYGYIILCGGVQYNVKLMINGFWLLDDLEGNVSKHSTLNSCLNHVFRITERKCFT